MSQENLIALTKLLSDPQWHALPEEGNPHHTYRDSVNRAFVAPGTALPWATVRSYALLR
jgi:hypothetical protein